MHFSRSFLVALFSAPFLAHAQTEPNPFNIPEQFQAEAGEPLELSWDPTDGDTVTLILRSGSSNNLEEGTIIASNIDNNGEYTWNVPEDAVRGSSYTIQIVDDDDPSQVNYSPYFVLESENTVASALSTVSLAAPTSAPDLSTATPTASPTSSGTETSTETTTETTTSATSSETSSTGEPTESPTPTESEASTSEAGGARATAMAGLLGVVALGALAL